MQEKETTTPDLPKSFSFDPYMLLYYELFELSNQLFVFYSYLQQLLYSFLLRLPEIKRPRGFPGFLVACFTAGGGTDYAFRGERDLTRWRDILPSGSFGGGNYLICGGIDCR